MDHEAAWSILRIASIIKRQQTYPINPLLINAHTERSEHEEYVNWARGIELVVEDQSSATEELEEEYEASPEIVDFVMESDRRYFTKDGTTQILTQPESPMELVEVLVSQEGVGDLTLTVLVKRAIDVKAISFPAVDLSYEDSGNVTIEIPETEWTDGWSLKIERDGKDAIIVEGRTQTIDLDAASAQISIYQGDVRISEVSSVQFIMPPSGSSTFTRQDLIIGQSFSLTKDQLLQGWQSQEEMSAADSIPVNIDAASVNVDYTIITPTFSVPATIILDAVELSATLPVESIGYSQLTTVNLENVVSSNIPSDQDQTYELTAPSPWKLGENTVSYKFNINNSDFTFTVTVTDDVAPIDDPTLDPVYLTEIPTSSENQKILAPLVFSSMNALAGHFKELPDDSTSDIKVLSSMFRLATSSDDSSYSNLTSDATFSEGTYLFKYVVKDKSESENTATFYRRVDVIEPSVTLDGAEFNISDFSIQKIMDAIITNIPDKDSITITGELPNTPGLHDLKLQVPIAETSYDFPLWR